MKIAFYKKLKKISDFLIRWHTRENFWKIFSIAEYSHCELVFSNDESFSSSGCDGGARFKKIKFDEKKWDVFKIKISAADEKKIREFCAAQCGKKYDWRAIFFSQILDLQRENPQKWFCSEICAAALQKINFLKNEKPHLLSPQKFFLKLNCAKFFE